jgi:hypothetical protein
MRKAPRVIQGKRPSRAKGGEPPRGDRCLTRHHGDLAARMLTVWLDSPYQGFRRGYRCPSGALTAPGRRSLHRRCATDARRGTNLLAGRSTARRAKAGGRTLSGKRAGGGLRTGQVPGTGEATPAHAPARPLVNGHHGDTESTSPASTTPGTRAESANTRLTARPTARIRPRHAARPAASLTIFRLPRVRSGVQGGDRHVREPERFTRGKALSA